MSLIGDRTFVGFGFGPIQAGLFLYEAWKSGAFQRLVAAEVLPEMVAAVRDAGGTFSLNVAHTDHIEHATVTTLEIENPLVVADRRRLIQAVAEADEIASAVPSVLHYASPGPGSLHRILARGLRRKAEAGGPRAVVYAAENHPQAAAILQAHVMAETPKAERGRVLAHVRFLDTVIGKMSGVAADLNGLVTVTPASSRAFLVESFNRILISRVGFAHGAGQPPFQRGLRVFEEKDDLQPFQEAKLYGHNAVHALAAYVGAALGAATMSDLRMVTGMMPFLHTALVKESGAALVQKYAGTDALFTVDGFAASADDLLARMVNPFLRDTLERVGRDPARKLGWDDRLIGAMRLALRFGITPRRYALGAAAALAVLGAADYSAETPLRALWRGATPDPDEAQRVLDLVEEGRRLLQRWREAGFPNIESMMRHNN